MPLIFLNFLCIVFLHTLSVAAPITIVIDPAGDANHPLREINNEVYERGLTLRCAEELQKKLERQNPDIRVIVTRTPGQSLEPLQNANLANRLQADFYITIHFYHETETKPQLFLYYYSNNPVTDTWEQKNNGLVFIPYDQAHKQQLPITKEWVQQMLRVLESELYIHQFDCKGIFGIPHKALVGVMAPAFCVEASLKTKDDWKVYVQPLQQCIEAIIHEIRKNRTASWF